MYLTFSKDNWKRPKSEIHGLMNLLYITLKNEFNCDVGYSGHEVSSYLVCVLAVTFGISTIERHITLERTMYGSDQAASLEKTGFERMIRDVKLVEGILGDGKKKIWDSEIPVMKKLRNL